MIDIYYKNIYLCTRLHCNFIDIIVYLKESCQSIMVRERYLPGTYNFTLMLSASWSEKEDVPT